MTGTSSIANDEALEFLSELGASLVNAGVAVNEIESTLMQVGEAVGLSDVRVMVLPTAVLVQFRDGRIPSTRLNSFLRSMPRLDQVSALDELTRRARRGELAADVGRARLRAISSDPAPRAWWARIIGFAVLAASFALLLQPTVVGVVSAVVLGLVVGTLRSLQSARLAALLPVLSTFIVAMAVFRYTSVHGGENPVRMMIPPLVLFLPGAALTTGTVELADGATVSGSTRIVEGVVTLLLLAAGILAAASLVDVPSAVLVDRPIGQLGWFTPVLALLLMTLDHVMHNCAPPQLFGWILLTSSAAFVGQACGSALFSPEFSGFFGGLVMTPLILWLAARPGGPPKMTMFLPAYWLLVPGAVGLIGVTEAVATTGGTVRALTTTAITVVAVALGTLVGATVWNGAGDLMRVARRRVARG